MLWSYEKIVEQKDEINIGYRGRKMPRYIKYEGRNIFGSTYITEVYIGGESEYSPATQSIATTRYIHVTWLDRVITKFCNWIGF